jgi:hypothetical protein
MKTLMVSIAVASALAAAAPAMAQDMRGHDRHNERMSGHMQPHRAAPPARTQYVTTNFDHRSGEIAKRIDYGVRRHRLSVGQVANYRAQLDMLARAARQARNGGMQVKEQIGLIRRYDALQAQVNRATS